MRLRKYLAIILLMAVASPLQAQSLKQFFVGVGHEIKVTAHDITHDKQWAAMAFLTAAATTADLVTTCRAFNRGFVESTLPLRGTTSCAGSVSFNAAFQFAQWTLAHSATDDFVKRCRADSVSSSRQSWWAGYNPETCKEILWLPAIDIPTRITAAYFNECQINGGCVAKPKVQP